jgi:hypothetical protein
MEASRVGTPRKVMAKVRRLRQRQWTGIEPLDARPVNGRLNLVDARDRGPTQFTSLRESHESPDIYAVSVASVESRPLSSFGIVTIT